MKYNASLRLLAIFSLPFIIMGFYFSSISRTLIYEPVKSLYLFKDLKIAALLYYLWLSMLGMLFLPGVRRRSVSQGLIFVLLFSLSYLTFWVYVSPYGDDEAFGHFYIIRYISEEGRLPGAQEAGGVSFYYQYPGLHILVTFISQILNLNNIFELRVLFLTLESLLIPGLAYITFFTWLRNVGLATLAALIYIQGNILLSITIIHFAPVTFALLLLWTALIIIGKVTLHKVTLSEKISIFILISALAITHAPTSLVPLATSLCIYLVEKLRSRGEWKPSATFILLLALVPLSWHLYVARGIFEHFMRWQINNPPWLAYKMLFDPRVSANLRQSLPLWVIFLRSFWGLLMLTGVPMSLLNLLRIKKQDQLSTFLTGGTLGISIAAVAIYNDLGRYLLYGPMFAPSLLLSFIFDKIRNLTRRTRLLAILLLLSLASSFPTFLAHNGTTPIYILNHCDIAVSEFVTSRYQGQRFFTIELTVPIPYYAPHAKIFKGAEHLEFEVSIKSLMHQFENSSYAIFIFSERSRIHYNHISGVSYDDPAWNFMKYKLLLRNKIYDSFSYEVFT